MNLGLFIVQSLAKAVLVTVMFLQCLSVAHAADGDVVFSAAEGGVWRVYLSSSSDNKPLPVASRMQGDQTASAFSISDQVIAFEVPGRGIYVCKGAAVTECRQAAVNNAVRPAWSPKTNELLFVRYIADSSGEDSDILVARDPSQEARVLVAQTGLQDYPDVSPDGSKLIYTSSQTISLARGGVQVIQQLWVMDLQIGSAHQLLLNNAQDIQPDWSPSGNEIAFASNLTGQSEIWIVDADGKNARQVTKGAGVKSWPDWSPDGNSIMFTKVEGGQYSVWIVDKDGANLRQFKPFGLEDGRQIREAEWN